MIYRQLIWNLIDSVIICFYQPLKMDKFCQDTIFVCLYGETATPCLPLLIYIRATNQNGFRTVREGIRGTTDVN